MPDNILKHEKNVVSLFLSARRQRHYIAACKHRVIPGLRGGEQEGALGENGGRVHGRQVVYAGHGVLVVVMFSLRKGQEQAATVSGQGGGGVRAGGLSGFGALFTPYNELKQRYQFEYILIETLNEDFQDQGTRSSGTRR